MPLYVLFQARCCKQSRRPDRVNSVSYPANVTCHCPTCLRRAEGNLNVAVKTVGSLGLVFSLTEVFNCPLQIVPSSRKQFLKSAYEVTNI